MTLTTLKETAHEDLENERFGWMELDKASGSRYLNTDKVEAFIDSIIDRTYHATKEEVRGIVEGMKAPVKLMQDGISFDFSYREGWEELSAEILSALEDTTTSPNH